MDAGLVYNTFPLMGDTLIPFDIWNLSPKFINFFENPVTVQFDHRLMAKVTIALAELLWWQEGHLTPLDSALRHDLNLSKTMSHRPTDVDLGEPTRLTLTRESCGRQAWALSR